MLIDNRVHITIPEIPGAIGYQVYRVWTVVVPRTWWQRWLRRPDTKEVAVEISAPIRVRRAVADEATETERIRVIWAGKAEFVPIPCANERPHGQHWSCPGRTDPRYPNRETP